LCYQKAIEIEPNQAQAYSSLQGLLSRAYHQLGIHQAEQGLLDEALSCFKSLREEWLTKQIYEQIWRSLNGLANIDESAHIIIKKFSPMSLKHI
jgi:tetratricopeptide (TPR) repeat protein